MKDPNKLFGLPKDTLKPLFSSRREQMEWAAEFQKNLEPKLKANAEARRRSEERARNDIRWRGII